MKKILSILATVCMLCACSRPAEQVANYRVVPLPHEIAVSQEGNPFVLKSSTKIACANDSLMREAEFLQEYVKDLTGNKLMIDNGASFNVIELSATLENANPEAYEIQVTSDKIVINGATSAGTFYGIQTLRKAIPAKVDPSNVAFPLATITDMPRFGYRGAHLDVARHPMEVDSVKSFIDMIAMHNVNRMHWHLTDDQGWRIEIKQYPKLTELGSHRDGTMFERNWSKFDTIPVDGFYTQEEARDIINYAAERHIEIIPEIDLPGHMIAALKGYPELGCTGGPYEVWQKWGVSEDLLCAGNDSTLIFLDGVLNEIADVFPSKYIHIGGDECPKVRWENCPKCQAKIKELGLKTDEHSTAEAKLQTYVMAHAQETLAKRGRQVIGWDEILEGGLPGDAVVMSWRGVEGAAEAAKSGHDAILTPCEFMYFDYCQSRDLASEPVSIGGYLPVEKVYSFEPIPADFTPEEAAHILGVQANLWREYIKTLSHSQYMELPRLAALSEVQWMDPSQKDYADFLNRVQQLIAHYDALGYNYARHIYDINGVTESNPEQKAVVVTLSTAIDQPIYYTLDGTEPTEQSTKYTEPVAMTENGTLKAVSVAADGKKSHVFTTNARLGKSTFKPYTLAHEPSGRYAGRPGGLTDGVIGLKVYSTPEWMGIQGSDLIATINLEQEEEISTVDVRLFIDTAAWIFDARSITVEVSADGKTFKQVAKETYQMPEQHDWQIVDHVLKFDPVKAQYVRVSVETHKQMPQWHDGKGKPAFVFCDEITVD